ncbi:MAG: hypothetical protein S4CHLAM7_13900 [Chlamydiae bacterium]|nr:hypothetical protein [Chlamydiota bacterium]
MSSTPPPNVSTEGSFISLNTGSPPPERSLSPAFNPRAHLQERPPSAASPVGLESQRLNLQNIKEEGSKTSLFGLLSRTNESEAQIRVSPEEDIEGALGELLVEVSILGRYCESGSAFERGCSDSRGLTQVHVAYPATLSIEEVTSLSSDLRCLRERLEAFSAVVYTKCPGQESRDISTSSFNLEHTPRTPLGTPPRASLIHRPNIMPSPRGEETIWPLPDPTVGVVGNTDSPYERT